MMMTLAHCMKHKQENGKMDKKGGEKEEAEVVEEEVVEEKAVTSFSTSFKTEDEGRQ